MSQAQLRIAFEPQGRSVYVLPHTTVVEAAARAGLTLDTPCGEAGTCGKCRVRFSSGATAPSEADRRVFSAGEIAEGWRLGCQAQLDRDAVIAIPETSLFADDHQILTDTCGEASELLPAVRKLYVQLPPPTLEDNEADLARLSRAVGPIKADLPTLRALPGWLREGGFAGTAVLTDHTLIGLERGDTTAQCLGVAVDVGTTTLAAALLDLRTGDELAIASRMNPQVSYGDDVLTRIKYAGQTPSGLSELSQAIARAINDCVEELCHKAGRSREHVYEVALAGNTTMQHLLAALDVRPLGTAPFAPTCRQGLLLRAAELGLAIHPRASAWIYPIIGGFVGGDTVAGMVATRIDQAQGPTLLIDIGTNGEIVLAHAGRLWAASTAAGPAFEGARISCGMRATRGAIEKVAFDTDVQLGVIANTPATGLCGSGLVDLAAELLRTGILSPDGRLLEPDELPPHLPEPLRNRVRRGENGGMEFLLTAGPGEPLTLTQRDIRELQLAAGAIRAGVQILLRQAGLAGPDLRQLLLAGGFGSYIRRDNAQRLGLLPPDTPRESIHYVGNTSLNGAKWALLSVNVRRHAQRLAETTRHVELSLDPGFQMEFAEAMIFPQ